MRGGVRRAAPEIRHLTVRKTTVDFSRVHLAALHYKVEYEPRLFFAFRVPGIVAFGRNSAIRAWMHQRRDRLRDEAINQKEVFLDVECRIVAFEVAGTVVLDAMTQDEVLRPRGCTDGIGLYEAKFLDGALQSNGFEETPSDGKAAHVVERDRH